MNASHFTVWGRTEMEKWTWTAYKFVFEYFKLKALFRLNENPSDVLSSWHKEGTACKANSRRIASIYHR
ncbi:hypothetical protein GHT06_014211 [Daphnia sinensis]|uniref:Uncharacterized protein n=1 Tax=Daphnia sinensis TaxID=1820382 RepID=A0AAD5KW64_9CRUS|nr:hypothetical protein GHT06_014211 [Daphnia sinensis]